MLSACILIRTVHGMYEKVVEFLNQLEGVERVFPVLGRFDVVADVEASGFQALGSTIMKMGRINGVVFTETLVEIKRGQ